MFKWIRQLRRERLQSKIVKARQDIDTTQEMIDWAAAYNDHLWVAHLTDHVLDLRLKIAGWKLDLESLKS